MTLQRELILPKSVTLVSEGPPRVLLSEGRRYVEEMNGDQQTCFFVADDGGGDTFSRSALQLMADSEKRKAVQAAQPPVENMVTDAAMLEIGKLRTDKVLLQDRVAELQTDNELRDKRADEIAKKMVSMNERITSLEAENAWLRVAPGQAELISLKSRAEIAERNIGLLEALCGIAGISPEAAISPAGPLIICDSVENFNRAYAEAKTPKDKEKVLNDFRAAVKAGTVK